MLGISIIKDRQGMYISIVGIYFVWHPKRQRLKIDSFMDADMLSAGFFGD